MLGFPPPVWGRGRVPLGPVLLAAAVVVAVAPVSGSAEALDLDTCVRLALKNTQAVAQSRAAVERADADALGAWAGFLPSAQISGNWNHPEDPIFESQLADSSGFKLVDDSWSGSFSASLPLFDGFGNVFGWRQAGQSREQSIANHLATRQNVVLETERLFFEVSKQVALLDVQRDAVRLSDEQLKKTRAMKDLGAATQADVYKEEVNHSRNRLEEMRAERNLDLARAELASYLGFDPTEPIELLPVAPIEDVEWDLEAAERKAAGEHPTVLATEAGAMAGRSGVRVAKSRLAPSLNLYYNARYFDTRFGDFTDETVEWSYGASLNFSVFDGFTKWANIRRAEATAVEGRRAVSSKRREVLLAVRRAWLDLEVARRSIEVARDAVRSSEEDLRLAQERFKIGEGTVLDVIDAQVNLTRSRTDQVTATYDAYLATSSLRNAVGDTAPPEPAE